MITTCVTDVTRFFFTFWGLKVSDTSGEIKIIEQFAKGRGLAPPIRLCVVPFDHHPVGVLITFHGEPRCQLIHAPVDGFKAHLGGTHTRK